ncbi:hypothetical protein GCM10017559_48410 [Streptosporangium longisporum]|uniref:Uncharacterized protein n=1 Tax=Streptosporangium longisporum TaxID=46187 RepID=A0ABN3Y4Z2_9ACTN
MMRISTELTVTTACTSHQAVSTPRAAVKPNTNGLPLIERPGRPNGSAGETPAGASGGTTLSGATAAALPGGAGGTPGSTRGPADVRIGSGAAVTVSGTAAPAGAPATALPSGTTFSAGTAFSAGAAERAGASGPVGGTPEAGGEDADGPRPPEVDSDTPGHCPFTREIVGLPDRPSPWSSP